MTGDQGHAVGASAFLTGAGGLIGDPLTAALAGALFAAAILALASLADRISARK